MIDPVQVVRSWDLRREPILVRMRASYDGVFTENCDHLSDRTDTPDFLAPASTTPV